MTVIEQSVRVLFRYPVHFTTNLFSPENPVLADLLASGRERAAPVKALCVVDQGLLEHHPALSERIATYFRALGDDATLAEPILIVPGGEAVKNDPAEVERIHRAIHEHGIDRHSYIIVVGGGAVIDMAGYAAATAHRGVRLVRVPTTVLSQNDSAVGVKNSVNAFGKKNFLGTFAPPYAVLNDDAFLTTLSDRDWRAGIAEAIKVALLKDAEFFAFLESCAADLAARDMPAMRQLIHRCAELHLEHIATNGDPFELGSSRPLDFGHWSAHKLEQLSDYGLRHGEAVAIGLALDATYSYLAGMLPEEAWRRILDLIAGVGLPLVAAELDAQTPDGRRAVLVGLEEFREHLGGRLTIMLLEGIGRGVEVHEMDQERVLASIMRLRAHAMERGATAHPGGVVWPRTASAVPSPSNS